MPTIVVWERVLNKPWSSWVLCRIYFFYYCGNILKYIDHHLSPKGTDFRCFFHSLTKRLGQQGYPHILLPWVQFFRWMAGCIQRTVGSGWVHAVWNGLVRVGFGVKFILVIGDANVEHGVCSYLILFALKHSLLMPTFILFGCLKWMGFLDSIWIYSKSSLQSYVFSSTNS